jgi:hypothetical protein
MKTVLNTFFHALGLALLVCAWMLNPETAQFKDMLQMLHASVFWQLVAVFAVLLTGAKMMLGRKISSLPRSAKPSVGAAR